MNIDFTKLKFQNNVVIMSIREEGIYVFSKIDISGHPLWQSFVGNECIHQSFPFTYVIRKTPGNAFLLRHLFAGKKCLLSSDTANDLKEEANQIHRPVVDLSEDGKHIEVSFPNVKAYRDIVSSLNGYRAGNGWRIPITRILDLEELLRKLPKELPKPKYSARVQNLTNEPIAGFDGSLNSLRNIPIGVLHTVAADSQNFKNRKKSTKTLAEKMSAFGIKTLYDLLFWTPKRYIDKSQPQDIEDLIPGEPATILGKISSIFEMNGGNGISIVLQTTPTQTIRGSFFHQSWLIRKFHKGDQVLLTGKYSLWKGHPQLNGSSIERIGEAEILPIVPVYKQSESRGLTTSFIMACVRELFARIPNIQLPVYLHERMGFSYRRALSEIHFPTEWKKFYQSKNLLAYYELVYMQIMLQQERTGGSQSRGLVQGRNVSRDYQYKAIRGLPFVLTSSQKAAIKSLDKKLSAEVSSSTLLNADTGSGKTIVGEMASLRAVEAGYQAVLVGPTDILSQQLFQTFEKLVDDLNGRGENITIAFLGGAIKAAEKKKILSGLENGDIDILVGTHAVFSQKVKYKNLGFICIDEQQKFGAEQRSALLHSRSDGRIPDLLMQTATPIPRSTAQVFYGDMDMITMDEKPPGRIPVETKWIHEDPQETVHQEVSPLWTDIIQEAKKGNQTFIIAPLVEASDKIDASSVENTYQEIKKHGLKDLRVAFVHGKMKTEESTDIMQKFRDKEYDVLVSSTVVEVGVDIPDATRIVVLSADRLGASSLHQLRGRVGRNEKRSVCYLVSLGKTDNAQVRLQSLVDYDSGFEIAKIDLKLRGEGKIFGTAQSGISDLLFADISHHSGKIQEAKQDAERILNSPLRNIAIKDAKTMFGNEDVLY